MYMYKLDPDPNFKTRIRNTYRQTVSRNLNHEKLKVIRIPWLRILQKNMQIRILLIKKEASNPNTMFSHGWYSDPHFSRSFSGSATMSTYRKTLKKKCRYGILRFKDTRKKILFRKRCFLTVGIFQIRCRPTDKQWAGIPFPRTSQRSHAKSKSKSRAG